MPETTCNRADTCYCARCDALVGLDGFSPHATGLDGVHFHDLRHAGNHLVAEAGANLRELMERMGHASSRVALIYLHSSDDRQRTLAEAVSERARRDLTGESCGTYLA